VIGAKQGRRNIAGRLLSGLLLVLLSSAMSAPARGACEVPVELRGTRPHPEGVATEVRFGVMLIDLQSIHDSAQSFTADIYVLATWQDPRLVAEDLPEPLAGCMIPLEDVWTPRLVVVNERDVRKAFESKVSVGADGTVEYAQRLQGEFTTQLHLRDFPFDSHDLTLEVVARGYSPEEVSFVPAFGRGTISDLTITDWHVGQASAEVIGRYVEPRDLTVASVIYRTPVKRRLGFYTMKTFLPLTLIVFMSWAVFWIKPGLLPPQIGVSTSAILTLIAFQFSLGYMLPRLSYLTRADRFLIGSTLLVFLAFGEALRTSYLANRDQEDRALRIDRISRVLFPSLFVVLLIISFVL
jgi:hypothetical protein